VIMTKIPRLRFIRMDYSSNPPSGVFEIVGDSIFMICGINHVVDALQELRLPEVSNLVNV
jgi:hypothetical protein